MASAVGIGDRSVETNAAVWTLVIASGGFLSLRLWLRQRSAKLWWDDLVLTVSWVGTQSPNLNSGNVSCLHFSVQVILLIAAALISRIIAVGNATPDEKRF